MDIVKKLKESTFMVLCLAITFFTSGIIINIFQFVLYLTVRPFSKKWFRKINWYLDYSLFSQIVFVGEWWSGSDFIVYCNKEDMHKYYGKEHGFLLMNHTYEVDWLLGWILMERLTLMGNARAYCKKVVQYMPVLGWAWKFSEFVFVERNYEKDKKSIPLQVAELADYPDPFWLLLYPEGTRFTKEKHKASLEFAKQNNLPELKHHLVPRTKGFIASLPPMRGKVPAVYDVLTVFKEGDPVVPNIKNLLKGKSTICHIYVNRIPMEEVPESTEGQDKFLKDLFVVKDKMVDSFIKTGDFFEQSGVQRVEGFRLNRRYYSLLNVLFWSFVILIPMFSNLIKLLVTGQFLYFTIGLGFISVFYFLLEYLIGMSEIKKASSYGATVTKKNE